MIFPGRAGFVFVGFLDFGIVPVFRGSIHRVAAFEYDSVAFFVDGGVALGDVLGAVCS